MTKEECETLLFKISDEGFEYAVENWTPNGDETYDRLLGEYLVKKSALDKYIGSQQQEHNLQEVEY